MFAGLHIFVFKLLEDRRSPIALAAVVHWFLIGLIAVNFLAVMLESLAEERVSKMWLQRVETFSLVIFSGEYLLRVWCCTAFNMRSRWKGRLLFILHPMMLIDLVVLAPLFLPGNIDLRVIRVLRLARVFKLARYSVLPVLMNNMLHQLRREIWMIVMLWLFAISFSASLMYYVESGAQPQVFNSVAAAFWWAVTTLTTVGYGDMYPITPLGRLLGGMIQVLGVMMLAFPAGLFGATFIKQLEGYREDEKMAHEKQDRRQGGEKPSKPSLKCPHCGVLLAANAPAVKLTVRK